MNRKDFLQRSLSASLLIGAGAFPFEAFAKTHGFQKITILHTNDQHSRIDPFPLDGGKYQGQGGCERRLALVEKIRSEEKHVMLLDCGDIFQGTPYFNKYRGKVEIELMNQMRYDAATIGNHDFDGGLENLGVRMNEANFQFLNANYSIANTPLQKMKHYKVFKYDHIKVGVFAVGIELDGLVPELLYGETRYNDPIAAAQTTADLLKHDEHCDVVICLSHLGYSYEEKKVSDVVLAKETNNIDLILGGHTHTFFTQPKTYENKAGETVLINQVGWAGLMLGRIDLYFDDKKRKEIAKKSPIKIG
ncbi:MAG: metallophosphoesterase [Chitinophagales bacterium]